MTCYPVKSLGHSWSLYPYDYVDEKVYPLPPWAIVVQSSVGPLVMIETFQRMDTGETNQRIVTRSDIHLLSDILPLEGK